MLDRTNPPPQRPGIVRYALTTVCLLATTAPLFAGPAPLTIDTGRKRGSQDGAGGSNATQGAVPVVPIAAEMPEAFALTKHGVEQCELIEGMLPGQASAGQCLPLPGGVAHAAAGCGARNAGYCTVGLRGVEPGSTLVMARLYIMLLMDQDLIDPVVSFGFAGQAATAELVGVAEAPCWSEAPEARSALYAADVGHLVPPVINGDYGITSLPSRLTNGASPYLDHSDETPLAQGAGLVVAYSHVKVPNDSVVYIHEDHNGLPVLIDGVTIQHALSEPTPTPGALRFTSIGGDGQAADGRALYPIETAFSSDGGAIMIRGTNSVIDPRFDWTGAEGGSFVQLFDVRTTEFDGSAGPLLPGSDTYEITYAPYDTSVCSAPDAVVPNGIATKSSSGTCAFDCINIGVHVLTVCGRPAS